MSCLVVGGGQVALRKVAALLECGAKVTVVAPWFAPAFGELAATVRLEERPYRPGEAASGGYRLVVTATGRPEVDRSVYLDAEGAGVLVNAADDPASCSFLVPAVARSGPVTVAVSTGGVSPFLAGWLRSRVADALGEHVGELAAIVGEARRQLREAGRATSGLAWDELVDEVVRPALEAGDEPAARAGASSWVAGVLAGEAPERGAAPPACR